jgi:translocation and assembly module TamB
VKKWILGFAVLVLAIGVVGVVVLQSPWFENRVRERIVTVVEDATGGRVEIGAFQYDSHRLTATVAPFVLHGKEAPGQPPLFRAAKIQIQLRIVSLLARRINLASVLVEDPQLSITVQPDGRSNILKPRKQIRIGDLLNIKAGQVTLRHGSAQYNSLRIPLDLNAANVDLQFHYDPTGPAYTGRVQADSVNISAANISNADFAVKADVSFGLAGLKIQDATLRTGASQINASGLDRRLFRPARHAECPRHPQTARSEYTVPHASRQPGNRRFRRVLQRAVPALLRLVLGRQSHRARTGLQRPIARARRRHRGGPRKANAG